VNDALVPFALERWLRAHQAEARFPIGGSGAPSGDLRPFLPHDNEEWARAWATHPDRATADAKAAVAEAYGLDARELLLTQGASEADFLAALALVGPGGHLVVEQPAYHALLEPARALGCRVTRVKRLPEEGFTLDPARVAKALRPDTRLIVLARPQNPTGHVVPEPALRDIADAAARVGAWVLVDEVFADATPGARPARLLHERILTVNSTTKCLGFGALHIGWLAAPEELQETLDRAKAVVTVNNPILDVVLAARVVRQRAALVHMTQTTRARNAALVEASLAKAGLAWNKPQHGTTCVVRLPEAWHDDVAFAQRLLEREGTLVAPGSFAELPGWVRLGLLSRTEALEGGLEALGRVAALSP